MGYIYKRQGIQPLGLYLWYQEGCLQTPLVFSGCEEGQTFKASTMAGPGSMVPPASADKFVRTKQMAEESTKHTNYLQAGKQLDE